jgi:hypothetical protein
MRGNPICPPVPTPRQHSMRRAEDSGSLVPVVCPPYAHCHRCPYPSRPSRPGSRSFGPSACDSTRVQRGSDGRPRAEPTKGRPFSDPSPPVSASQPPVRRPTRLGSPAPNRVTPLLGTRRSSAPRRASLSGSVEFSPICAFIPAGIGALRVTRP